MGEFNWSTGTGSSGVTWNQMCGYFEHDCSCFLTLTPLQRSIWKCVKFTALAFTCNHFFTRLFKQDKLVLKDLQFHVRRHVCQHVIRLTATLFTLKVSVYLFSLPTFVPLPSFLFLSFPLSLLDCPVFSSSLRCLFPSL